MKKRVTVKSSKIVVLIVAFLLCLGIGKLLIVSLHVLYWNQKIQSTEYKQTTQIITNEKNINRIIDCAFCYWSKCYGSENREIRSH